MVGSPLCPFDADKRRCFLDRNETSSFGEKSIVVVDADGGKGEGEGKRGGEEVEYEKKCNREQAAREPKNGRGIHVMNVVKQPNRGEKRDGEMKDNLERVVVVSEEVCVFAVFAGCVSGDRRRECVTAREPVC